jgi:hypothetical protein
VAEAIVARTGGQRELVERFEPDAFRNAEPNDGYLIGAALFQEGALNTVMTLNFDLAATTALARVGAGASVSTIRGPEDHHRLGARNLIYLHRDINSDPDELILRPSQIDIEWRDNWEQVVAQRVLAGPTTVFVGLGTPASVLVETTQKILEALTQAGANVYVVDPLERERSAFFAALGLDPEVYVQLGWGEFMHQLADRLVEEHRAAMERECEAIIEELALENEDIADLCERLVRIGLIGLGRLRACWLLEERSYLPHEGAPLRSLGDLVIAVGMIERVSGTRARFEAEGFVEFAGGGRSTPVIVCSGGGWMTMAALEGRLSFRRQQLSRHGRVASVGVAAGVAGGAQIATPTNIVGDFETTDVAAGAGQFRIVTVDELRERPERVREVFG